MWILPKNLHTSAYVQDTGELISDLKEQSAMCERSLLARSKPSQSRTWLQRLKKDTLSLHLSGRILKPSLGKAFEERWTSSLAASLVNPSLLPAKDWEIQTQDICSPTLNEVSPFADLPLFSLKTSTESSAKSSREMDGTTPQELPFCYMSSESWKDWVTNQRQSRVVRQKSVRRISGTDGSSAVWPTASARDWKDSPGMSQSGLNPDGTSRNRTDQLARAVYADGHPAPDNNNTDGSHQEPCDWRTPSSQEPGVSVDRLETKTGDPVGSNCRHYDKETGRMAQIGLPQQVEASNNWPTPDCSDRRSDNCKQQGLSNVVNQEESWNTLNCMDALDPRSEDALKRQYDNNRPGRSKHSKLREQVVYPQPKELWPTPTTQEVEHGNIELDDNGRRKPTKDGKTSHSLGLADSVRSGLWSTPKLPTGGNESRESKSSRGSGGIDLQTQADQWSTPTLGEVSGGIRTNQNKSGKWGNVQLREQLDQMGEYKGKLNARWVETLMGLPIGWTMPNCDNLNSVEVYDKSDNRTDELRLLGNGVVPQSAEASFIMFIEWLNKDQEG